MHPEKITGRLGIATNQTIKRNAYIRIQEKAVSHYQIDGEQVAFSLNRHKAWELLEKQQEIEESYDNVSRNNEQENRQTKKKHFQQHLNKSKHDNRLQQKELAKLKKNFEKKPILSESTEEEAEPKIVKHLIGSKNYPRGVSLFPENGIVISEVMSRAQIYKLSQHRDRQSHLGISGNQKSRHQKKAEFEKSIFL